MRLVIIWKNLSAIKDRHMRDGDDQAKNVQYDLEYELEYFLMRAPKSNH